MHIEPLPEYQEVPIIVEGGEIITRKPWDGTKKDGRIKNPPEENLFSTWEDATGYFAFATPDRVVSDYLLLRKVCGILNMTA
jgi:hypothetical protein